MLFGRKARFFLNKKRILEYCSQYIDVFSKEYDGFISSDKPEILSYVSSSIDDNYDSISSFNPDDDWCITEAISGISQASFNLLFDSKYDMGGHYVNPISYKSLWGIHVRAMNWALQRGYITQDDIDEDLLSYQEKRRQRSKGLL